MIKLDLHVHTEYSPDSKTKIREAVREAKSKGLQGIAKTDHNTVKGLEQAKKVSQEEDFLIIPGVEVSSKHGHIVGLNIEDPITSRMSAEETVKQIRSKGGIAISAHPFSLNSKPFSPLKANFEALETFNSKRYIGNRIAKKFAEKNNLPQTGGSDAHLPDSVGLAGIETDCKPLVNEVIKKIKKGKVSIFGRYLPPLKHMRRALGGGLRYVIDAQD